MSELHDRLPVILADSNWAKCLAKSRQTMTNSLLRPCRADALEIWSANKAVGNVKNKGSHLPLPV
jgi:putative SOS response-associated peptidase YedK